jgi:D-sedoheptulose 7-phosphate isomerase
MLESTQQKIAHHQQTIEKFFAENAKEVVATAESIADVYRENGRLLCMGNGGSSCDAGHVAVEFLHPVTAGRPALPAIDLTADRAMLTAVGNDIGFGNVFVRQVIAHGSPGDGLVGISTSGNSDNLIKAFQKAKEMGLATIGLAGMNGGKMAKQNLDHCLIVETDSIHRIQECHLSIYHILWDLVHSLLADNRGNLSATPDTNKQA